MQVFVPYPSPIDVAKCLDPKRLRKQIIECDQILKAIRGESEAWKNHPVVKMYKPYRSWLTRYKATLIFSDSITEGPMWSKLADRVRPPFLTSDFCDQHKRRLFTKAPELYPQFAAFGKSEENWYVVDGMVLCYVGGKQVRAVPESWLETHYPIQDVIALGKRLKRFKVELMEK